MMMITMTTTAATPIQIARRFFGVNVIHITPLAAASTGRTASH
jgi:hypothetical protein